MLGKADRFVVYNLRETYHELGEYEFKVVLNPDVFRTSHGCELSVLDSAGLAIPTVVNRWGRKMNCRMNIGESVSDGVATVRMALGQDDGQVIPCSFTFWVIK